MLHIYSGSIKEVKEEMKKAKKDATEVRNAVIKQLKKQYRRIEHYSRDEQKIIAECELTQSFCITSKFIPVKLEEEDMIVNYLFLAEFAKKIKGYSVRIHVEHDEVGKKLIIHYQKGNNKGRLEHYEMPPAIFGSLAKIPKAQITTYSTLQGVC